MDCLRCRGACCAELHVPIHGVVGKDPDGRRWLEMFGKTVDEHVVVECRCKHLTLEGRCGIYSTRPQVCVTYPPGGAECLSAVRRRRTPEDYQRIRDADDPGAIH